MEIPESFALGVRLEDSCFSLCQCKTVHPCHIHKGPCGIDISLEQNHTHLLYHTGQGERKLCVSPKCISSYLGIICYRCFEARQNIRSTTMFEHLTWNWRLTTRGHL